MTFLSGNETSLPPLPAEMTAEGLEAYAKSNGRENLRAQLLVETGIDLDRFVDKDGNVQFDQIPREIIRANFGADIGPLTDEAFSEDGPDWDNVAQEGAGLASAGVCYYYSGQASVAALCQTGGKFVYDIAKYAVEAAGQLFEDAWHNITIAFGGGGSDNCEMGPVQTVRNVGDIRLSQVLEWYGTYAPDRLARVMILRSGALLVLKTAVELQRAWLSAQGKSVTIPDVNLPSSAQALADLNEISGVPTIAQFLIVLKRNGLVVPPSLWGLVGNLTAWTANYGDPEGTLYGIEEWRLAALGTGASVVGTAFDQPEWYDLGSTLRDLQAADYKLSSTSFTLLNGWVYSYTCTPEGYYKSDPYLLAVTKPPETRFDIPELPENYSYLPTASWSSVVTTKKLWSNTTIAVYLRDINAPSATRFKFPDNVTPQLLSFKTDPTLVPQETLCLVCSNGRIAALNSDMATSTIHVLLATSLNHAFKKTLQEMMWVFQKAKSLDRPATVSDLVSVPVEPPKAVQKWSLPWENKLSYDLLQDLSQDLSSDTQESEKGMSGWAIAGIGAVVLVGGWAAYRVSQKKPIVPDALSRKLRS